MSVHLTAYSFFIFPPADASLKAIKYGTDKHESLCEAWSEYKGYLQKSAIISTVVSIVINILVDIYMAKVKNWKGVIKGYDTLSDPNIFTPRYTYLQNATVLMGGYIGNVVLTTLPLVISVVSQLFSRGGVDVITVGQVAYLAFQMTPYLNKLIEAQRPHGWRLL